MDSLKHGVTKNCPRGTVAWQGPYPDIQNPNFKFTNSFLQSCILWTIIKTSKLFPLFFQILAETNHHPIR